MSLIDAKVDRDRHHHDCWQPVHEIEVSEEGSAENLSEILRKMLKEMLRQKYVKERLMEAQGNVNTS